MPIKFLPWKEFTPVFPPIEASTCANNVVGILTNFIPLFTRLEIKEDKSLTTPPPKETIQSDLFKLSFKILSINLFAVLKLFDFSFAVIL